MGKCRSMEAFNKFSLGRSSRPELNARTFSVTFDPPPPVHIRLTPLPIEYDTEFFSKNPTTNIHLHHHSSYGNTKKVSHKVKFLLLTTYIR